MSSGRMIVELLRKKYVVPRQIRPTIFKISNLTIFFLFLFKAASFWILTAYRTVGAAAVCKDVLDSMNETFFPKVNIFPVFIP